MFKDIIMNEWSSNSLLSLTSHGLQASLLIVDLQDLGNVVIDTVAVIVLIMEK